MKIILYPNPILDMPTTLVTEFDTELSDTIELMKVLMKNSNGVGLAGPQVGISKSFFLMTDDKGIIHEMINPKIIDTEGTVTMNEGCLSVPNIFFPVSRPYSVLVEYQNKNGELKKIVAEGKEARIILHEYDHLSGIMNLSKINRQQRRHILRQLKK